MVVVEPPYWRTNDQESKLRFILNKTGDRWLVDRKQDPCPWTDLKDCDNRKGSGRDPSSN